MTEGHGYPIDAVPPRRVLVCGGRFYQNAALVNRTLDAAHAAHGIGVIIHGDQQGADRLAHAWALMNGVVIVAFPRRRGEDGRTRNQRMLIYGRPDLAFAFPGGPGTEDMKRRLVRAGVVCLSIRDA